MADSAIAITAGTGTSVDTRTEGTNSNHRQVVTLGDPATNAGVAPVDVTNGLAVHLVPAIPAGENVIGATVGKTVVVDLAPSCVAATVAANDVLADTEVLAACFRANDKPGVLQSITVIDGDDVGGELNIFIFNADVSLGTEDAAISISDANAANILGIVNIEATDYVDCINSMVANLRNLSMCIKPATGTDDLYVAVQAVTGGTYTASGLTIRFGIMQD